MQDIPVDLLEKLGQAVLDSPVLSIMVVDREMHIVWHNRSYARDMGAAGSDLRGRKCYEVASDVKVHKGCPTQSTLREGSHTRGLYDFGEKNAVILTIPLGGGLAAKVHTFVPKDAGHDPEMFPGE